MGSLTKGYDGVVDIKGIDHVTIYQPRCVHKGHQAKLLLLGGRDFSREVVRQTYEDKHTESICKGTLLDANGRSENDSFKHPQTDC